MRTNQIVVNKNEYNIVKYIIFINLLFLDKRMWGAVVITPPHFL